MLGVNCMKSRFFVLLPSRGEGLEGEPSAVASGGGEGSGAGRWGLEENNSWMPPSQALALFPFLGAGIRPVQQRLLSPSRPRDGSVRSRATEGPQEAAGPGWAGARSGLEPGGGGRGTGLARAGSSGRVLPWTPGADPLRACSPSPGRCAFCSYSTNRPAAMECHVKTHYKMEYKCRISARR